MQVLKRNGTPEQFDVSKIKKCVDWASEGLSVNTIELESKFNATLFEGISTGIIQDKLIEAAKSLISVQSPDWLLMAGRLYVMSLWKNVALARKYPNYVYGENYNYLTYYISQVQQGNYTSDNYLLDSYTTEELELAGSWLDFKRDLDYDYAGVVTWNSAYLVEGELPQEALLTVALLIAAKDPNKMAFAQNLYNAMSLRKISLASPFLANLRKPNGSLSSCFTANTPVLTSTGWKSIQEVKAGDSVLTHENRFRKVQATQSKIYNGDIYSIHVSGVYGDIVATADHRFLTISDSESRCIRKGVSSCIAAQGSRKNCYPLEREYKNTCDNLSKVFSPDWIQSKDLKIGDWIELPFNNSKNEVSKLYLLDYVHDSNNYILTQEGRVCKLNTSRKRLNKGNLYNQHLHMPFNTIPMKEFSLLLGYYLAEGYSSTDTNVVSLTFNIKETEYINEVEFLFKTIFGIDPVIHHNYKDNSTAVKLHSKLVAEFFSNLVGKGFDTKKLPPVIMESSEEYQVNILKGVFRGDACATNNSLRLTLCNEFLIRQLFEVALRCKLSPSYNKTTQGKLGTTAPWTLTVNYSKDTDFIISVGKDLDKFKLIENPPGSSVWLEGKYYRKISKLELDTVEQEIVYDIQVQEDSSFCVGGLAAHNCFILSMEDDSDSILDAVREAALISKNGGGVGIYLSNLRCSGSLMKGKYSKGVGGVIPYAQLFNATALAWNQGGVRKGAFTLALDVWHYDVLDFLDLRLENKDTRLTAHDIFPQLVVCDLYLKRLEEGGVWTLLDPHEVELATGKKLTDCWGEEFEQLYIEAEQLFVQGRLKLGKTIEAKELLKRVFKSWEQSGLPYIFFKDTVNRLNPNKNLGLIPCANLCVAPETLVLTDKGHLPIGTLENKVVNVWNGEEFSTTTIKKTGTNQELLKVVLSNGVEIECTPYHHFYIKDKGKNKFIKVEAQSLNIGDKLIKYELPIIEGSEEFPYAYTHGFYCGDGSDGYSQGEAKFPSASLYGEKRDLLPYLDVRKKLWSNGTTVIEREEKSIFEEPHLQRIRCNLVSDLLPKFTVPNNTYTIQSRVEWLAGLLDSDGTVVRNEGNESFQITSSNKQFLLDIKNMLQTLGIDSKVTKSQEAAFRSMPDGKGDYKDYYCKQSYRLLINSNDLFKLKKLGLKTNRLKWQGNKPQRSASKFIKVEKVIRTNRISDTYCFTETKRHMGMFNGVLTGQCVESFSNVSSQETHVCNLISLNLANIEDDKELVGCTKLSIRALDIAIDLTVEPTVKALAHNNTYRVLGLGAMGLHDYLAVRQIQYGSSKASAETDKVFELIALSAAQESVKLAKEKGCPYGFSKSTWQAGQLYSKPLSSYSLSDYYEDWQQLHEDVSEYGIRNTQLLAIAPNTTSALLQGCTPSVFPARDKIYAHSKGKGTMDVVVPHIKEGFWYYKPAKAYTPEQIIEVIQGIQRWVDTGISMELLVDLNDEEQRTAKYLYDRIMQAWKGQSKAIYYIRFLTKSENTVNEVGCATCVN